MCMMHIISMAMRGRLRSRTAIGMNMHRCGTGMCITLICTIGMGIAEGADACGADIWATLKG
jgi:hypothetical protein